MCCFQCCCNVPPNIQASEETRFGGSQERRFLCRLAEGTREDQGPNTGFRIVSSLNSCMIPSYLALIPCVLKLFGGKQQRAAVCYLLTDVVETVTYLRVPRWP